MTNSDLKTCTRCGVAKPLDRFQKDRSKKDGLRSDCKECRSVALKQWLKTPKGLKYCWDRNERLKDRRRHEPGFADYRRGITNRSTKRPQYKKRIRERIKTELGRMVKAAGNAVAKAIRDGVLVRPEKCELCAVEPGKDKIGRALIRAIHVHGYLPRYHLKVVWMCPECQERWKRTRRRR